jgi:hypothetical protein
MIDRNYQNQPRSLADQLAPMAARLRVSYSSVRPVCQSTIEFRSADRLDNFKTIRGLVLDWLKIRAGRPLPPQAFGGEGFELEEVGSQRMSAVSIDRPRYWAARLDDNDREVAQRNWVNEISIADHGNVGVVLGSRLLCVTRGKDQLYQPSIQRFVRTAVEKVPGAHVEGRLIEAAPWFVETREQVEKLIALISSIDRRLDVIVCALPEGSENPSDCSVDAQELHRRTYGAAHVAIISSSASFILSDYVGKEFSTFRGAVRTYKPGFDVNLDEPFGHPLSLPARITNWPEGGTEAFQRFIIGQTLVRSATGRDAERHLPPFTEVRRVASQLKLDDARQSGTSDIELLALADQEIKELRDAQIKERETYQGLVEQYERDRDQAMNEVEQIRAVNASLRHRLRLFEEREKDKSQHKVSIPIPRSLDEFDTWCREHLAGTVDIHNRAKQGLKNSQLEDVELIYKSLVLLRDFYCPMRRDGGIERLQAFRNACSELGLSEEPSFSGDKWGEQGKEYLVRYSGRDRLLERHLKKGNSKDKRFCFRLYFFWDDETEQVVVGWLPSHLDTRIT